MFFYKNYIVYYNVYCYDCGMFIVYTKVCLDWLLHERVTWPSMPYHNVLSEAVYYCFTRTTKLFTCFYDQTYTLITSLSFVTLHLLVSEIHVAKCIA